MLTDRRFITELLLKRSFNHNTTQHQTVYFEILFADLRLSKMTIVVAAPCCHGNLITKQR